MTYSAIPYVFRTYNTYNIRTELRATLWECSCSVLFSLADSPRASFIFRLDFSVSGRLVLAKSSQFSSQLLWVSRITILRGRSVIRF